MLISLFWLELNCLIGLSCDLADCPMMSSAKVTANFSAWKLSYNKLLSFPLDPISENYVRKVPNALFSLVKSTPLPNVELRGYSITALTNILNLGDDVIKDPKFISFMSGNNVIQGSTPMAHRYGGHQFGVWADQLGDGRAILLGVFENDKKELWEIQLKGAGLTPYSRTADGRAVVRSSVREFLCSEAMYYLGIPTSRAATLIVSDEQVIRDKLYQGRPEYEYTAVVSRLAKSWIRFGSFEILSKNKELELLRSLANYVIKELFPSISQNEDTQYLELLNQVVEDNAELVSAWQSVGFTHGVLNTDNMSIVGITIDYGPFGMMEAYNPVYTPNHSDDRSRYCYSRQPEIVKWNLQKLGEALKPLIKIDRWKEIDMVVGGYDVLYKAKWLLKFMMKLGIEKTLSGDEDLVTLLLEIMSKNKLDFTATFRELSEHSLEDLRIGRLSNWAWALKPVLEKAEFISFLSKYSERLKKASITEEARQNLMRENNPLYVLRNWIAQKAIDAVSSNDTGELQKILQIFQNPYSRQEDAESRGFSSKPPQWARMLKVSCSS